MLLLLLLCCGLVSQIAGLACNTANDCSPCSDPSVADFLFFVDGTGSMRAEINAVRNGLTSFASAIAAKNIDARMAVVTVGGQPRMFMDWVVVKNTQQVGYVTNEFKKISTSLGGHEPTLESMGMALKKRVDNNYLKGSVKRTVSWRANAKKFFIVLTDEDSDRPYLCDNAYSCMKSSSGLFGLGGKTCSGSYEATSFSYTNCWGSEVQNTANWLLADDVDTFMFVNDKQGKSGYQFGVTQCNKDNQKADFSDFNAAGVKACLARQSPSKSRSLQGLVLAANKATATVRLFDVTQIESPNFVKNFFEEAAAAVTSCERRKRSAPDQSPRLDVPPAAGSPLADGRRVELSADGEQVVVYEQVWSGQGPSKRAVEQSCELHTCVADKTGAKKCRVEYTCAAGCTGVCSIGGKCYEHRASNPANSCQYCDAYGGTPNVWKQCGSNNGLIGYECDFQKCDASTGNQCVDFVPCLPKCNCCCIGGDFDKLTGAARECTAGSDMQVDIGTPAPAGTVECGICDPIDGDLVLSKDPAGTVPAQPWDTGVKYLQWSVDQKCLARGANCTDGIQNQGETDVDCGGPNCPECINALALCGNGKQDTVSGETGVDCGGVCPPCAACTNGVQDGQEEGIDCGETACGVACATTEKCSPLTNLAGDPCGGQCTIPCEETPCGGLTCRNSAWCRDGKCDCSFLDFHGPECTVPDAQGCPAVCKNGGHCLPGASGGAAECDCTGTGCSGVDCDQACSDPNNPDTRSEARKQCDQSCEAKCAVRGGMWRCDCDTVVESTVIKATCNDGTEVWGDGYGPNAQGTTGALSDEQSASVYALQNGGPAVAGPGGLGPAALAGIIVGALLYCVLYFGFMFLIWRALPNDESSSNRRREMGSRSRRSRRGSHRSGSHRSMHGNYSNQTLDYD